MDAEQYNKDTLKSAEKLKDSETTKPWEELTLEEKYIKLYSKFIGLEIFHCQIGVINNLLTAFAADNSPEGLVIAELITKELNYVSEIINRD